MNRRALLDQAAQRPAANLWALALAGRVTSPSAVAEETARLTQLHARSQRAVDKLFWVVGCAIGLCVLCTIVFVAIGEPGALYNRTASAGLFGASIAMLVLTVVVASCLFGNRVSDRARSEAELGMLTPIAGTQACVTALQYLEKGYTNVQAWRDLAVAEREVLSGFDVEVLRCLHDRAESTLHSDAIERAAAEACRKLHGLAPISGALGGGAA